MPMVVNDLIPMRCRTVMRTPCWNLFASVNSPPPGRRTDRPAARRDGPRGGGHEGEGVGQDPTARSWRRAREVREARENCAGALQRVPRQGPAPRRPMAW